MWTRLVDDRTIPPSSRKWQPVIYLEKRAKRVNISWSLLLEWEEINIYEDFQLFVGKLSASTQFEISIEIFHVNGSHSSIQQLSLNLNQKLSLWQNSSFVWKGFLKSIFWLSICQQDELKSRPLQPLFRLQTKNETDAAHFKKRNVFITHVTRWNKFKWLLSWIRNQNQKKNLEPKRLI